MNTWQYIKRSLWHYRLEHCGLLLGMAVATAVLVGALLVGDSVRYSLREISLSRLGKTEWVLSTDTLNCRAGLSDLLAESAPDTDFAPLLMSSGTASLPDGSARVNRIQLIGIDERAALFAGDSWPEGMPDTGEAWINPELARRLRINQPGEELILRVTRHGVLPLDSPFVSPHESMRVLSLRISRILPRGFSNFSVQTSQTEQPKLFVSLCSLGTLIDEPGRANLILAKGRDGNVLDENTLNLKLAEHLALADLGLELKEIPNNKGWQLTSRRIFLSDPLSRAALEQDGAYGVFGYLASEIRCGERSAPYAFVAGIEHFPPFPQEIKDDEILINTWLAEDLQAKNGDSLQLRYFVPGTGQKLLEKTAEFKLRAVLRIEDAAADPELIPEIPGLSDVDNCREWDPGRIIELDKIRDIDEEYWEKYRTVPKAFISLTAARRLWENRYGALTAVRFPDKMPMTLLKKSIENSIPLRETGYRWLPLRAQVEESGSQAVDFGQLFLGMSFFLLLAALLLTTLIYGFAIENRARETGLLLAIGFRSCEIRKYLLLESIIPASVGILCGTGLGIIYNWLLLKGLATIWQGAVGMALLVPQLRFFSLLMGASAAMLCAIASMWITLHKQFGKQVVSLQQDGWSGSPGTTGNRTTRLLLPAVLSSGLAVLLIVILVPASQGRSAAGIFFLAGAILLVCLILLCRYLFSLIQGWMAKHRTLAALALRNTVRRSGRSLAAVTLIACGIMLIVAVAANRKSVRYDSHSKKSGTGAFSLYGETTLPILFDLNSTRGKAEYGLQDALPPGTGFLQLPVKTGDDASCLNLNRISQPRILGVPAAKLAERGAFSFVALDEGINQENPWHSLKEKRADGSIPVFADQSVITWGLGKKIGDELVYQNERGKQLRLRLVGGLENSLFQGSLLMSENFFSDSFPDVDGSKVMLVELPPASNAYDLAGKLSQRFSDLGLEIQTAQERLAAFQTVENTYLSIFLMLGGLGLVLGTAGLGVVVMRNVLERRGELGMMRALGYERKKLFQMLLGEHSVLLAMGVICGSMAGGIAVLPTLRTAGGEIPWQLLAALLIAILINGTLWIIVAAKIAQRGNLMDALRNE